MKAIDRRHFLYLSSMAALPVASRSDRMTARSEHSIQHDNNPNELTAKKHVLLELFTSEGCSSCPPADRLIHDLVSTHRDDFELAAMVYHVDYWNSTDWTDRFSHADWTTRQKRYVSKFRTNYIYTPQLVLNGKYQCIGSDKPTVSKFVRYALADAKPATLTAKSTFVENKTIQVDIQADVPDRKATGELLCLVGLVENQLISEVQGGENAGRTLHHHFVVRTLLKAFSMNSTIPTGQSGMVRFTIHPSWQKNRLTTVVLLQDPVSMNVVGAKSISIESPKPMETG